MIEMLADGSNLPPKPSSPRVFFPLLLRIGAKATLPFLGLHGPTGPRHGAEVKADQGSAITSLVFSEMFEFRAMYYY